ncbi:MAG: hypothetical protein A2X08_02225 [Bacteroidetes bacterium GWA2_32_17]|nr:MAG: hypothetical protein A2X08_02225 [Bacteroidetes bacterium GWA2_32_17]
MDINAIIKRTINIIVKPQDEWKVIEQENANKNTAIFGYALPYIIVVSVATLIGCLIFNSLYYSMPYTIVSTIFAFIIPFAGIIISAIIVNSLAPAFGSTKNIDNAFKLVIYSYTATFIATIITGLLPVLFFVSIAGGYSFFIMFFGLTPMMKTPEDKKVSYFIVSILIMLGVYATLTFTLGLISAGLFFSGIGFNSFRF